MKICLTAKGVLCYNGPNGLTLGLCADAFHDFCIPMHQRNGPPKGPTSDLLTGGL